MVDVVQSLEDQEIIDKLTEVEDKLKALKEITKKLEEMRNARKKMVETFEISKREKIISVESKTNSRRVQFADEKKSRETENEPRKSTVKAFTRANKSNSLFNLITNLQTWHGEVDRKKSEIEQIKTKQTAGTESEEKLLYEEKLMDLETQKDEISNNILKFILQNMSEGKEEYQDFILQLEEENYEMEDKIYSLTDQIKYLRENTRALMIENANLRQKHDGMIKILSNEDLEMNYRKSILCGKSSTMLPEASLLYRQELQTKPSVQYILNMELEDRLSLDETSVDSFTLDSQITSWMLDKDSMQRKLKRLEQEHHEMEVIQMKMNLVKRYVRKHGVKQINKDTFLDQVDSNETRSHT